MSKIKFVNPSNIIAQLDLDKGAMAADLGCGGGFYTLPLARAVGDKGAVCAIDILPDKLAATQSAAQMAGLKNVTVVHADLEKPSDVIEPASFDLVVMSNIVHQVQSREALMKNAYQMLKTGGHLLVVDWKKELTPFGPEVKSRVSRDHVVELVTRQGFRPDRDLEADGYHYAVVFVK